MTGEEMERAIEFLLRNQANFDSQLAQTNQQGAHLGEQVAQLGKQMGQVIEQVGQLGQRVGQLSDHVGETSKQLGMFADTQTQFMQVVLGYFGEQREINTSLRVAVRDLTASVERWGGDERNSAS